MAAHSAEDDAEPGAEADAQVAVAPRRCGRCQRPFEGDTASFVQTDWALCPACEAILLPDRHDPRPTSTDS